MAKGTGLRRTNKHYFGPGIPDPSDHDPALTALPLHKRLSLTANAYWIAAQHLWTKKVDEAPTNPISYLPFIFLFNHAIELYLKELISIKKNEFPNGHNLEELFRETIATIPWSFKDEDFLVFHRMFLSGRFDPMNDQFRYPSVDGYDLQ